MSSSIPLIYTLDAIPNLSTLTSYINASAKLTELVTTANNFTFLAPTNAAFQEWFSSTGNQTFGDIEATLQYHLLNGSYSTVNFNEQPQFISTALNNATYTNVTIAPPGQRVELISSASGPEILSSNKTVSTIGQSNTICLGGLIQVINTVLRIPTSLINLFAQANLNYFVAILNQANFLAVNNTGLIAFVNNVTTTPNLTFLCPNSNTSLAQFTNISKSLSAQDLEDLFNYHIVYDFVGYSTSLTNGTTKKTAQGTDIIFTRDAEDNIYVNQIKVTQTDYMTVNGVFHVLDGILDRNNVSIPAFIPRANATSAPAPSSGGLSTGAIVAISVVIPVAVIAALAGFLFWFFRRRKQRKEAEIAELAGYRAPEGVAKPRDGTGELDATDRAGEMEGDEGKKELDAETARRELEGGVAASELPSPPPPVELDATPWNGKSISEHTTPSTAVVSPVTGTDTASRGEVTPVTGETTPATTHANPAREP
ncbi:uncharacterized protein PAC_11705 [Phialocephala subalpina]|uniref:FAS1 domain-containing protein n=1 Tax=Phialocephala subalpina TaxID=576137 RepID=A0A1L7X9T8_9HELO|nr:uncharacterized protein PAC_11705 [Phialocephala subalpina]